MKARVGVLISGAGSNMAALVDAGRAPEAAFEVVCVISNDPQAGGLGVAQTKGVPVGVLDHRPYAADRESHERAIQTALEAYGVEVVALAGYMRLLTPWLIERWRGRLLNIHPSLLPLYPGLKTHARALEAGDTEAGCTVHLVTEDVDAGPVLAQARVPILPDDTESSLAQRVLAEEHRLYPSALSAFCTNRNGASRS